MEYSKLYQRVNVTGWENDPSPKTPLDADNLNNMDKGIDDLDNRILELNEAKSDRNEVAEMFVDVSLDSSTGIITFTKYDGAKKQIDTMLEKVVTNFDFDETTQKLTLTLEDGTIKEVDLSSFISEYEFDDSDTIVWEVVDHKVVANIRNHSIGADQLETDYLANCEIAENNASNSASRAIDEALRSEGYSVGTQNGNPVDTDSPYYHNNAKYYSDRTGTKTIASLDDVALSNVEEGQALVYDAENDKWVNGDAIPKYKLNAPTNVSATAQNESVVLKWTDPDDLILGENTLAKWIGTAIVQKVGSAPTSIEDGTPVYASMVRNQHSEVGYVVEGLENDTEYFFGVFPVTEERVANTSVVVSAIPEGNINPIKEWCQTIGLSYESLEDITEADMRLLMSKHTSVDYFMEWYNADNSMLDIFTQNAFAMKWIGLNDYIADKLLAISDAESRLLASPYWEYILKDHVPIMTSNTAPYGEAFSQGTRSGYEAYKCFSGGLSFGNSSNTSSGAYIGYSFTNPICVKKIKLRTTTSDTIQVILQGTNDKSGTWDDLAEFSISGADGVKEVDANNDTYYIHHRIYQKSSTATNAFPMSLLQFYGRSLNVSESSAPTDGRPYKLIGSVYYTVDYSDRTERTYLYDHGMELVPWGCDDTVKLGDSKYPSPIPFIKNANEMVSSTLTNVYYNNTAIVTDNVVDMTPYSMLKANVKYKGSDGTPRSVDISNVNEALYVTLLGFYYDNNNDIYQLLTTKSKAHLRESGFVVAGAQFTYAHDTASLMYVEEVWLE